MSSIYVRIRPRPIRRLTMKTIIANTNNILANPAALDAIPPNPKIAAMIAMIRKVTDHLSMT